MKFYFLCSFLIGFLSLIRSHLFLFLFLLPWETDTLLWFMSMNVLPMFFSRSFMVSGPPFRYFIHFGYGVRKCSSPIFLVQLIEETACFSLHSLASFVKYWLCEFLSGISILFHWFLCLLLYEYHAFLLLLLCGIVWSQRMWILPVLFFLLKTALAIQGFWGFHINFSIIFF